MVHVAVFVIAALVSVFGVGGGVFYVPLLLGFGLTFQQAANASLLVIAVTGLGAFLVFHRKGLVDWRLALLLDPAKDVGAFLGGLFAGWFAEALLFVLFAAVLTIGGLMMMRYQDDESPGADAEARGWARSVGGHAYSVNLVLVLPFCLAAGFFAGLLGIGGGIFMVPLMTIAIGVPIKIAVGTSAFMVCLTGTFGFVGGALAGHFTPSTGLLLAVSAFVGAQVGPRITVWLDKRRLRQAFGVLMYVVAAFMVYLGLT